MAADKKDSIYKINQASAPPTNEGRPQLKTELHRELLARLDFSSLAKLNPEELRRAVRGEAEELCREHAALLTRAEQDRVVNDVLDEAFGLGPLETLMRDPTISDILINGAKTIYIEREGRLELSPVTFEDDQHLMTIVQRIVSRVGRRVDETSPMVDARLLDGSRVNAVIPPLALDGPLVSIRRFSAQPLTIYHLLNKGAFPRAMLEFMSSCVKARLNMIISGGTGSGKTTLLNALSAFIPHDERLVTIEDAAELRLQQPHVARMETRPPNIEKIGEVTTRDLVRNALRMRPDRIIIGECRGAEALDMLQAMNTGHDGSLTTIHANDARDVLSRLEMMVGMAGVDLPIWIIRKQVASALDIIIQASRLSGGVRKVTRIAEVTGMENDVITMQDLFVFNQTGVDGDGRAQGHFESTGIRPHCLERMAAAGIHLPLQMFEQRVLETL